jgi:hypothetical protein
VSGLSAPCIPTILSEKLLSRSKKLFYDAFSIMHRMEDFSVPYHFSLFMICHAESSFLEHFCFRALDHLLLVLRIRHPDSFIMVI